MKERGKFKGKFLENAWIRGTMQLGLNKRTRGGNRRNRVQNPSTRTKAPTQGGLGQISAEDTKGSEISLEKSRKTNQKVKRE